MFPSYKYNFRHTGSRRRVAVQCFNSTQNIQILQKLTRDLSLVWKRFMPTTTSDKKVIVKTRIGKMILQNFGNIKHETTRVFQILGGSQIILILLFDPRSTRLSRGLLMLRIVEMKINDELSQFNFFLIDLWILINKKIRVINSAGERSSILISIASYGHKPFPSPIISTTSTHNAQCRQSWPHRFLIPNTKPIATIATPPVW